MRSTAVLSAVTLALLVSVALAHAGGKRFVTPVLGTASNEVPACIVVNVDKKPVTATVKLMNRSGVEVTNASDCDQPIAPNAGCRAATAVGFGEGYCDATTSSGKVRVGLVVIDVNNPNHTAASAAGTLK